MSKMALLGLLAIGLFAAEGAEPGRDAWELIDPPRILFIQPNTLRVRSGEHVVQIVGRNFYQTEDEPLEIRLGNERLPQFKVENEMRLRVKVPTPSAAGAMSITVKTPGGEHTIQKAIYFYSRSNPIVLKYTLVRYVRRIWDFFLMGGPVMPFIALCSIALVAWAIHCLIVVRQHRLMPRAVVDSLSALLAEGDRQGAEAVCNAQRCLVCRVLLPGLRSVKEGTEKAHEMIQAAGAREAAHLRQKISWLASIGTIAPMLGLLGTVIGLVMAFNVIALESVRFDLLAAAVAQALNTTVFGLVVGIPAMALFFYFRSKVLGITTSLETAAEEFASLLARPSNATNAGRK